MIIFCREQQELSQHLFTVLKTLTITCSLKKIASSSAAHRDNCTFINFTFGKTSQLERKISLINSVIAINTILEGLFFWLLHSLYIYALFNDAVSSSEYIASIGRIISE
jgi:hypothetical protein